MVRPTGRLVFGIWFGLFVPAITLGAVALAFGFHWSLGVAVGLAFVLWMWVTARTTCSRCWAYGSAGCGLPSLVAPLLARKQSARSLSLFRIRVHHGIDIADAVFLNALYLWLAPALAPFVLLWTVGAWWMVARPKRYHGLLYRLRQPQERGGASRMSLPLVAEPGGCGSRTPRAKGDIVDIHTDQCASADRPRE
jgi:hypothetical protein